MTFTWFAHENNKLKDSGSCRQISTSSCKFPIIDSHHCQWKTKVSCKSAFFELRNVTRIRKYLPRQAAKSLIHSFVTSRLDSSCSSLLYGVSNHSFKTLEIVQNSAARLLTLPTRRNMKMKKWSSQWTQFMQLRIEAWKKIQDFNGVWTRDLAIPVRCSTNWAIKPLTLGAGQLWVQDPIFLAPHWWDHFVVTIGQMLLDFMMIFSLFIV